MSLSNCSLKQNPLFQRGIEIVIKIGGLSASLKIGEQFFPAPALCGMTGEFRETLLSRRVGVRRAEMKRENFDVDEPVMFVSPPAVAERAAREFLGWRPADSGLRLYRSACGWAVAYPSQMAEAPPELGWVEVN